MGGGGGTLVQLSGQRYPELYDEKKGAWGKKQELRKGKGRGEKPVVVPLCQTVRTQMQSKSE